MQVALHNLLCDSRFGSVLSEIVSPCVVLHSTLMLGPLHLAAPPLPLQVAVARHTFSVVKEPCLFQATAFLNQTFRTRLVAFLCTVLGGPAASDPRCAYHNNITGEQLITPEELFANMRRMHAQYGHA